MSFFLAAALLAGCNQEGVGSFSPTGDRVTLVHAGTRLVTVRVDGSDEREITTVLGYSMSTTFSPFGDKVAFMDNGNAMWVANATGGGAVQVGGGAAVGLLSFVPSGHIVYVESAGDNQFLVHKIQPGPPPVVTDLLVGLADDLFVSQPAIKVKRGTQHVQFLVKPYGATGAQSRLVFVVSQGSQFFKFTATQTDIVGPEPLARTITPALKSNLFNNRQKPQIDSGVISPDGTKLIVRTEQNNIFNLWALDLTTNDPWVQLTNNADFFPSFAFSPDGSEIVFESNREGGHAVYLASANGTHIRKLIDGATMPGWYEVAP